MSAETQRWIIIVLMVVGIILVGSGYAAAQNANAGSQSQSGAIAGAQITENYYSDGTQKIRNNPGISAPGIITANPCLGGVSGGASGGGIGISLGGTYKDESCVTIQQAAAINTLAGKRAAIVHLARNPDMCQTLRTTGHIAVSSVCTQKEKRERANRKPTVSTNSGLARNKSAALTRADMRASRSDER